MADFSAGTMEARRQWGNIQSAQRNTVNQESNIQQIFKSLKNECEIQTFPDKQKLRIHCQPSHLTRNTVGNSSDCKKVNPDSNINSQEQKMLVNYKYILFSHLFS